MKRREFGALLGGAATCPLAARAQQTVPLVAALAAVVTFTLSSITAKAETPNLRSGLVTCEFWLSNPAYARDGENWVYGFWDGLIQGLGYAGKIGRLPNLDLMLDDVQSNCKDKPSFTLAESASLTFERMRQGAFSGPPPGK